MRIDADIHIIRHMSDIARYMRHIFRIGILSASACPCPSLSATYTQDKHCKGDDHTFAKDLMGISLRFTN